MKEQMLIVSISSECGVNFLKSRCECDMRWSLLLWMDEHNVMY